MCINLWFLYIHSVHTQSKLLPGPLDGRALQIQHADSGPPHCQAAPHHPPAHPACTHQERGRCRLLGWVFFYVIFFFMLHSFMLYFFYVIFFLCYILFMLYSFYVIFFLYYILLFYYFLFYLNMSELLFEYILVGRNILSYLILLSLGS